MSPDDEAFEQLLSQHAEGYARLYPSIVPRLRKAYQDGNATMKRAVMAMAAALVTAESRRETSLTNLHGLTPTQVRVALHLIDGGTVASCAEAMGVAESTVRTHLKSIFAKTGIRRQSQLRSLLTGKL
jgi:DNA-binding CsgD family transcriptional regulator